MGKGKGIGGLPSVEMMERLAEQQSFKQLVTSAYLNRLAVLTGVDGAFLPMSLVQSPEDLDEHIIYDDREGFAFETDNGETFCPIITELMQDEEHGLNATEDADTRYGSKYVTYRVVLPADVEEEPYIVCECKGLDMHIVIEGGRWYVGQ